MFLLEVILRLLLRRNNDDQIPYDVKRIIQQMQKDINDDDFYDLLG